MTASEKLLLWAAVAATASIAVGYVTMIENERDGRMSNYSVMSAVNRCTDAGEGSVIVKDQDGYTISVHCWKVRRE